MSFSLGTILAQIVIFLILMALVAWKAVGPVAAIMEKRKKYINNQITEAENSREESQKYLAQQKVELDKVREESRAMIEQAKKQAAAESQGIIDAAKNRSDRLIKEAYEEINQEKEKAVASIRDEVADLSVLLASKLLEKEINAKDYSKEIDQLMKQVGNQQ
ncbi:MULTISPECIES: F0F1 ATP synthase subunit B [unclassified Sporolactobacillus]|uniref:F0F1 ATP synthase subunit B n=1 Tax=unclassified Sporolactobacillus TaxID=2628533 RepID=UPI002368667F|nr:F0F1 ATP synthase subunit B [Sporolactobacillus sp. CQH2019]MDD9148258.1 F0F1 ATP synthase subunit B [Sporolactobacillus sp. CQH2019]